VLRRRDQRPVGRHYHHADERVDHQAVQALQTADAAADGGTDDTGACAGAGCCCGRFGSVMLGQGTVVGGEE
jgi:hypothetical protein